MISCKLDSVAVSRVGTVSVEVHGVRVGVGVGIGLGLGLSCFTSLSIEAVG